MLSKDRHTPINARQKSQFLALQEALSHSNDDVIAFIGKPMIITPGELIFDRTLSNGDKMYWCALRSICSDSSITQLPNQAEIAYRMNQSRQTINAYNKMLRATRWLSVVKTLTVNNLPTRYSFAIHDTQLSFEQVSEVDHYYFAFLFDEAQNSRIRRLKQYSQHAIALMTDEQIEAFLTAEQYQVRLKIMADLAKRVLAEPEPIEVSKSNEKTSVVKKDDSEEKPVVKKDDSEEKPVVKKDDSEKIPVVKKDDSEKIPVVKKDDSEEKPVVKKDDSGEKSPRAIETAPAYAPTHARSSINNIYNITTTSTTSDFEFFSNNPTVSTIVDLMRQHPKIGEQATNVLIKRLMQSTHRHKDQSEFTWTCSADDAVHLLVAILQRLPDAPLPFLTTLISHHQEGNFALTGKQQTLLNNIRSKADPNHKQQTTDPVAAFLKPKPNTVTLEQQFTQALDNSATLTATTIDLVVGNKVQSLIDIRQLKISKSDIATVEKQQMVNGSHFHFIKFPNQTRQPPIDDEICLGIEMGVFRLC